MKLAFCLFNYFPYGGLQRDFIRILRVCLARGHDIDVYTMQWDGPAEPRCQVHLLEKRGMTNDARSRHFVRQLKQALALEHYDAVVGFNKMPDLDVYYAADVCYQARINKNRGLFYRLLPRYRQWIAFEEAVFLPGKKTEILLLSNTQQQEYSFYYHTEPSRFHLLPPGISQDRIAPSNAADIRTATRNEWCITENDLMLLMVGSGFKTKGVDRAIKSVAALPKALRDRCQLFVIGQDKPKKYIALTNKLGISQQVTFFRWTTGCASLFISG